MKCNCVTVGCKEDPDTEVVEVPRQRVKRTVWAVRRHWKKTKREEHASPKVLLGKHEMILKGSTRSPEKLNTTGSKAVNTQSTLNAEHNGTNVHGSCHHTVC